MSANKQERIFSNLSMSAKRDKHQNELHRNLVQREREQKLKLAKVRNSEMQSVISSIERRKQNLFNKNKDTFAGPAALSNQAMNRETAKQVHDRCIPHQLKFHSDLADQVHDLVQLRREDQICSLEFDRKIKEIQYETVQRDLDKKHHTRENSESLKKRAAAEKQRKLNESNERSGPSSDLAAIKDLEPFETKEHRKNQLIKEKRQKDMQEQLQLHRVKLDCQKELKKIEQEEEREINRRLDQIEINEIVCLPQYNESRNADMNQAFINIDETMQTAFEIKKSDRDNIDLCNEIRNESISQDIRKH